MKILFFFKWENRIKKRFSKFSDEVRMDYDFEFRHFLKSEDHGLPHAANVYGKVLEILDYFPEKEKHEIDIELIEAMCVFHDAGRFLVPRETASNFAKRKRKGQILHECAGALLAEIFGYSHPIIREGILRHDYFNSEFDPGKKPPTSLEAQILRAADKTSVAPADEIERYDQYRRKFNFPLFNKKADFEFRLNWNFSLKRDPSTDQLCYFLAVLALNSDDFIHPILREYYRKWSMQKKEAAEKIVEIVRREQGEADADLVYCIVYAYMKAHDIAI